MSEGAAPSWVKGEMRGRYSTVQNPEKVPALIKALRDKIESTRPGLLARLDALEEEGYSELHNSELSTANAENGLVLQYLYLDRYAQPLLNMSMRRVKREAEQFVEIVRGDLAARVPKYKQKYFRSLEADVYQHARNPLDLLLSMHAFCYAVTEFYHELKDLEARLFPDRAYKVGLRADYTHGWARISQSIFAR